MKPLDVVCAIIVNSNGELLACQRSSESTHSGKWEFPGGKIEPEETSETALRREILEELGVSISIIRHLELVIYPYTDLDFEIALSPYLCELSNTKIPNPIVHSQIRWVTLSEANELDWAGADKLVLQQYKNSF
jgi:8-oxo-dGTP diphosphatase